jgi:ribosomal protein S18 acetylase RimI-like enzyme
VGRSDEVVGSTESGVDIVVAGRHHIPEVERMLSAASHRAAALGYRQWWDPFPVSVLQDSVLRRETYVAVEGGAVLGTLALSWEDPMFWGERPPDSGYVHRLCTNPDIARPGLGVEMLTWADITAANRDRDWLRLDTPASNARLRVYYETLGFIFRREIDVALSGPTGELEIWRAALYERRTPANR